MSVLKLVLLKEKPEPTPVQVFAKKRSSTSLIQKEIWKLLEKRPLTLIIQNQRRRSVSIWLECIKKLLYNLLNYMILIKPFHISNSVLMLHRELKIRLWKLSVIKKLEPFKRDQVIQKKLQNSLTDFWSSVKKLEIKQKLEKHINNWPKLILKTITSMPLLSILKIC